MQVTILAPRTVEINPEINLPWQFSKITGSTAIDFVLRVHPHEISIYDKNSDRHFVPSLAQSALRKPEASTAIADPYSSSVGWDESHLRTNIKDKHVGSHVVGSHWH